MRIGIEGDRIWASPHLNWRTFTQFAQRYTPQPWELVEDWKDCRYQNGTHYLWVNRQRFYLSLRYFLHYIQPGQSVLDVGVFPGTWIRLVQEFCHEHTITFAGVGLQLGSAFCDDMTRRGVSLSPVDLDRPLREYRDPLAPGTLPWDAEQFDAVCAFEILEHLRNPFHFMAEISRVLKPGGHLFLSTNNVCYVMNILRLLAGRTVYWHLDLLHAHHHEAETREHVREYTVGELRFLFQQYGLQPVKVVLFDAAEYAARILTPLDRLRFLMAKLAFTIPYYRPNIFAVARKQNNTSGTH